MGIVLTDGALANDTSQKARNWILQQAKVIGIISLPQSTFAPYGSGVKTSILLLEKRLQPIKTKDSDDLRKIIEEVDTDSHVYLAKIDDIGYDAAGRLSVPESQTNEPPEVIELIKSHLIPHDFKTEPEKITMVKSHHELVDIKEFWLREIEIVDNRFDVNRHNRKYAWVISKLKEKYGDDLVALESITYPITSGSTPLGSAYVEEGIPFLRVQNINIDGSVDLENSLYVSEEFAKKIQRSAIQDDDILLVIVGATIGKCAIAKGIKGLVVPNQAIARIRLRDDSGIRPEYLQAFLASDAGQIQINTLKRPVAQGNLNLTETGLLLIPRASDKLQNRIVEELEQRRLKSKMLYAEAKQLLTEVKTQIESIVFEAK